MADNTGTNNATYNLVSVLYHAPQGADLYEKYASDAGGDQDLASFFRETQSIQTRVAERAKEMLGIVVSAPPEFDVSTGHRVPPTSDMPPATPPGEENVRGRGVPPMGDVPRHDEGLR